MGCISEDILDSLFLLYCLCKMKLEYKPLSFFEVSAIRVKLFCFSALRDESQLEDV